MNGSIENKRHYILSVLELGSRQIPVFLGEWSYLDFFNMLKTLSPIMFQYVPSFPGDRQIEHTH